MSYEFNKARHIHTLDGKPLTGVTTVLSVIAKPALIQWSANCAVDFLSTAIACGLTLTPELIKDAKSAHRKRKEVAGEKGTDIHEQAETIVKTQIQANNGIVADDLSSDNPQIQHFITWARDNKVKFLKSEEHIYSKDWWIGGICDLVMEIEGQRWIADIKTSSGIYPEHFWQMAAYDKCFQEMGEPKALGYIVLNLRKDGGFEEKRSISNEDNLLAFQSALNIYRIQEKLKSNLK